jgi:hypothetical protein
MFTEMANDFSSLKISQNYKTPGRWSVYRNAPAYQILSFHEGEFTEADL